MWKYEFIFLIIFLASSFSLSPHDFVFGFIAYSFIAFFIIAWHEFGHIIMAIHENSGIVNLYLKFNKKGLFTYPSVAYYENSNEISSSARIILGGVVATLIFNPVINIALYFVLQRFLIAELLPSPIIFYGAPFILLLEYFSSNESADLYKIRKLYSTNCLSKKRLSLSKDILGTIKVITCYFLGKNRYFSEESLTKLIPVKTFNSGIWLGNQLIVVPPKSEFTRSTNPPTPNGIPIEKVATNIWFSVDNKRPVKDIVDKFGFHSLSTLATFRENGLVYLFYENDKNVT